MAPFTINLPLLSNPDEYEYRESDKIVQKILGESSRENGTIYDVRFEDEHTETVDKSQLVALLGGASALERYLSYGYETQDSSSDDQDDGNTGTDASVAEAYEAPHVSEEDEDNTDDSDDRDDEGVTLRRSRRAGPKMSIAARWNLPLRHNSRRSSRREVFNMGESDDDSEERDSSEDSGMVRRSLKRKRANPHVTRSGSTSSSIVGRKQKIARVAGTRHSERATRHQRNMAEVGEGIIYRSDSDTPRKPAPKVVSTREVFQDIPRHSPFARHHCQNCETCGGLSGGAHGPLVYCQGCSVAYHRTCIGHRGSRDHLVTKVKQDDFVLQCRRCIGMQRRKEATAPDHGMCQVCREIGLACVPFKERKTPLQEQKDREDNLGVDPIVRVNPALVNNPLNVLFRCMGCSRAWHYHHLPLKGERTNFAEQDDDALAEDRRQVYSRDFTCIECSEMPTKISSLIAWRPVDQQSYLPGQTTEQIMEDDKEYLVKWENKSYFRAEWKPGSWTWGVTAAAMRKAFARKFDSHNLPVMTTEDAIPEDYLRIDIVLDIRYTSFVDTRAEEVDKARIREVDEALLKFKGLGYEDAVWEKVPGPDDGERWSDFVTAYDDWVAGRYLRVPRANLLKIRLDKCRSTPFEELEKKVQPSSVIGGELMKYQLDGLNWLYYRWHQRENAILADEMGLGKTIQVIAFLATLVQDYNCWPFLVVVPNSTCPNWRREIKRWAPSLRVVTYYGSAQARNLSYRYELYPEGSKDMRCHVVVTSYEAAGDDNCRKFFRSVPWQGLIVDEGHRLKNDRNLLYAALTALKCPFKMLLTGTPLQNNARELFNLLQFLDDSFDAAALQTEYEELTRENVPVLHERIRPFFLRRTKAQVLTFLPPMGQVILPVSMSVLQKKLYKSILAKNPELVRAIFESRGTVKQTERASLANILMQLRKCLCHPFVYSKEIEERDVNAAASHRQLVEASPKLQLLEALLPKLKDRGHRVLIFSQFLDNLDIVEDFLDGLGLQYERLDGSISAMQKQKRIDAFNAPGSQLFAFLLSTRAGGVGINLATADTVIIMDPDFNPHQDIQALSRAHRIGQKNKVLCFQLMTRSSAEEKMVQIGRSKMALDHVLIERMDADDEEGIDVESILKHGVADLMDDSIPDIKYDVESIDKLLDRSQIEDTATGKDDSAESQFSFARVWANDSGQMKESLAAAHLESQRAPDTGTWEKILRERESQAAAEAASRQQTLGRGKRNRQTVDYGGSAREGTPVKNKTKAEEESSDTDFRAQSAAQSSSSEGEQPEEMNLESEPALKKSRRASTQKVVKEKRTFQRSSVNWAPPDPLQREQDPNRGPVLECTACRTVHERGWCPLKLAGVEHCNLCGMAHYGVARTCPHIRSETQVREMLVALRNSPEPKHLKELAQKYLQGVKGTLVQHKKKQADRKAAAEQGTAAQEHGVSQVSAGANSTGGVLHGVYRMVDGVTRPPPPGPNLQFVPHHQYRHRPQTQQQQPLPQQGSQISRTPTR